VPTYSPDFSPIELTFANIKTEVRRAGAGARTRDA
jgi:transposase